jgi:hypothetical protein
LLAIVLLHSMAQNLLSSVSILIEFMTIYIVFSGVMV